MLLSLAHELAQGQTSQDILTSDHSFWVNHLLRMTHVQSFLCVLTALQNVLQGGATCNRNICSSSRCWSSSGLSSPCAVRVRMLAALGQGGKSMLPWSRKKNHQLIDAVGRTIINEIYSKRKKKYFLVNTYTWNYPLSHLKITFEDQHVGFLGNSAFDSVTSSLLWTHPQDTKLSSSSRHNVEK